MKNKILIGLLIFVVPLCLVGCGSGDGKEDSKSVCKPATSLHTATCNNKGSSGCGENVGKGKKITYGRIPNGNLKPGDAFDCDVNNDGVYDSKTERFYYVGSSNNYSILIYYSNMDNQKGHAYDSSNENWHGPRGAYKYLPSTSEWSNPGLIAPGTRKIINANYQNTTKGGNIEEFTYTEKAARLLSIEELDKINKICSSTGDLSLDNCDWLMENLGRYEGNSGIYGYWLENPDYLSKDKSYGVDGFERYYYESVNVKNDGYFGVRPVITVLSSNISD